MWRVRLYSFVMEMLRLGFVTVTFCTVLSSFLPGCGTKSGSEPDVPPKALEREVALHLPQKKSMAVVLYDSRGHVLGHHRVEGGEQTVLWRYGVARATFYSPFRELTMDGQTVEFSGDDRPLWHSLSVSKEASVYRLSDLHPLYATLSFSWDNDIKDLRFVSLQGVSTNGRVSLSTGEWNLSDAVDYPLDGGKDICLPPQRLTGAKVVLLHRGEKVILSLPERSLNAGKHVIFPLTLSLTPTHPQGELILQGYTLDEYRSEVADEGVLWENS